MKYLLPLLFAISLQAQITVSLEQGPDAAKDASWYRTVVCNHHEGSITVMGAGVIKAAQSISLPITPDHKPPAESRKLIGVIPLPSKPLPNFVITPETGMSLQKGACITGWLLGKKVEMFPQTLVVEPPYQGPARQIKR